jgi:anaerobic ribonucleoside-triphosphate reductase activating protein
MSLSLVPDKISLYFEVTGCALRCKGCHTPELRDDIGITLTPDVLSKTLQRYKGSTEVIVFLGNGTNAQELTELLSTCRGEGFLTCLYTGLPRVNDNLMNYLDYIKTGPYVDKLGGLESKDTNQVFLSVSDDKVLNSKFWR